MTIRLFGHYAVSSRQRALRSLGVRPIASAVMCGYRRIAAGCRQSLHVPLHLQLLSSTTSNAYQGGNFRFSILRFRTDQVYTSAHHDTTMASAKALGRDESRE